MRKRSSGILLHITSLPSGYGIGDLGPEAYRFADFLAAGRQTYWHILPLNPTALEYGNSPYSSLSAFAGNTVVISPEMLVQQGFLFKKDIEDPPRFPVGRTDYPAVIAYKSRLFDKAFEQFKIKGRNSDFEWFCWEQRGWLDDYALFLAIRNHFQRQSWVKWPRALRDRDAEALREATQKFQEEIDRRKFLQFLFFRQWAYLKGYCNERSLQIIGDVAIYLGHDSADVWANRPVFQLNKDGRSRVVAGYPPDFINRDGQLWGNPIYDWAHLKDTRYAWWMKRIRHNLTLFDVLRIDHFRGFFGYWEIPATAKTARQGRWVAGPGHHFFDELHRHFSSPALILEALGDMTSEIREMMGLYSFPAMNVLMFAFDADYGVSPYYPHGYAHNSVTYIGTHDTNTIHGWYEKEATAEQKERLWNYLGCKVPLKDVHWELIRMAMMSATRVVIIPAQDILGLGAEARMNRPGVPTGQWEWRLRPAQLTAAAAEKLAELNHIYARI